MRWKAIVAVVVIGLALQVSAQRVQKQRYSQPVKVTVYPLTLHVTHSFLSLEGGGSYLHLVGVVNGVNVELVSGPHSESYSSIGLLRPGEYPAKMTEQDTNKDGSVTQQYDLQLANGQHEVFMVIGFSE